jgi:predicted aspartyl protease
MRHRSPAALWILTGLCLTFANTPPAHAECVMNRVAQLPITLWNDRIFVPVTIEGSPRMMFLDTGAGLTSLSQDTATSLSLLRDFDHTTDVFGVGGKESHLYIAQTKEVTLGHLMFRNQSFPVAAFGERLADGSPIGGLIGADLVSQYDLDIDIPHRQLGLWKVAGCTEVKPDWPGESSEADMVVQPSRHVSLNVKLDGVPVDLLLDTGSPGLVVTTRAAARAGVSPEMLEESRPLQGRGMNDRAFAAWLHIFPRLEVAGQVYGDARAVVVNNGRMKDGGDGLLGIEFLKRGRVWVSYATGRFFVEHGTN